ncbi:hypothetical protein [Ottowia thiooxydans]|uniref:hypothetical protein n=1 Tax=Ottowia thiooxydans TaxID=219182 RepID=UPI0012EB6E53|nr:hypothetical protein [Ottowia thiooxydans]
MNEVPLVVYPVGRTRQLGWALLGLWFVSAMVVLAWWGSQMSGRPSFAWRLSLLLVVLLVSGLGLLLIWCAQTPHRLVFDGGQWWLYGPDMKPLPNEEGCVAVVLDARRAVLLRWPEARSGFATRAKWLWAESTSVPSRWHLLRCALYSPANRPVAEAVGGSPKL